MKRIICALILLFALVGNGQNVIIQGVAKNAEGKSISLFIYEDRLTNTEKKLAYSKIDSTGKFSINVNITETIEAFLRIENFYGEIFIKPGKEYDITLNPRINTNYSEKSAYLNGDNISIDISSSGKNELNNIINKFRYECNDFILKNFETVFKNRGKSAIDSFKTSTTSEYADVDDKYFEDYKEYKFASFEFLSRTKSESEIEKLYFRNRPVLYNNSQYMDFFNDFFSKYHTRSKVIIPLDLYEAINKNRGSFDDLMDLLKKDSLLKNEELRELLLLKELNDLYHTNGYKKENILYIIQEAEIKEKSAQNKLIARNLYKLLTKLTPYTKAPGFSLKDTEGKECSLKSLKGKYVYLCFFKTDNISSISELKVVSALFEKYKDYIEFVNICCDGDRGNLISFLNNYKGMKGRYLYFADDQNLLDNYNIKSFPTFIFIDTEGDIINYPAARPSEGAGFIFEKELQNK
jgi:hypothetical protein